MWYSKIEDSLEFIYHRDWSKKTNRLLKATNYQIGVSGKPLTNLILAITYRTPLECVWKSGSSDFLLIETTPDCETDGYVISVLDSTYEYSGENAFFVPGLWAAGIRYQPWQFLAVAFELEHRPFSKMLIEGESQDIEDGWALRCGAEVDFPLSIRLGFYREALQWTDRGMYKPKVLTGFTAGLGVPIKSIAMINTSFEYGFWDRDLSESRFYYFHEYLFRYGLSITLRWPEKKERN